MCMQPFSYNCFTRQKCSNIVCSCNGLILLAGCFLDSWNGNRHDNYWLRIWNPATRTISHHFGYFSDFSSPPQGFGFAFGCDNFQRTFIKLWCLVFVVINGRPRWEFLVWVVMFGEILKVSLPLLFIWTLAILVYMVVCICVAPLIGWLLIIWALTFCILITIRILQLNSLLLFLLIWWYTST